MPGAGPQLVVTGRVIFRFGEYMGEMLLSPVHPGVTVEEVRAEEGWPLKIAAELKTTEPPMVEELLLVREKLDPNGASARKKGPGLVENPRACILLRRMAHR